MIPNPGLLEEQNSQPTQASKGHCGPRWIGFSFAPWSNWGEYGGQALLGTYHYTVHEDGGLEQQETKGVREIPAQLVAWSRYRPNHGARWDRCKFQFILRCSCVESPAADEILANKRRIPFVCVCTCILPRMQFSCTVLQARDQNQYLLNLVLPATLVCVRLRLVAQLLFQCSVNVTQNLVEL